MPRKVIDLTGKVFGYLTVLYRSDDKVLPNGDKCPMWMCRCVCGKVYPVLGNNLRRGTSTSCGCMRWPRKNLVGQKFGKLTVIECLDKDDLRNKRGCYAWLCDCECGGKSVLTTYELESGHTQSCGCLMHEYKVSDDTMVGKRFGRLTVVSRAGTHKLPSGSVMDMWNCVCDCGRTTVSFGRNLRKGTTQSCGCLRAEHISVKRRKPYAEVWVSEYLDQVGLWYDDQKSFSDLVGLNDGLLSYDFIIQKANGAFVLVECQGGQHFYPVDFFGGMKSFRIQVEHDRRKKEYAEEIGIPLLCIDCTSGNRDEIIKSLSDFLLV